MSRALAAAVSAYAEHFRETPPMIRIILPSLYPDLIAAMAEAVRAVRKLTDEAVSSIAGLKPPAPQPPGIDPPPQAGDPGEGRRAGRGDLRGRGP